MSSGEETVKDASAQKDVLARGLTSGYDDLTQARVLQPQPKKTAARTKATREEVMKLFKKLDNADRTQAEEEEMSILTRKLDSLTIRTEGKSADSSNADAEDSSRTGGDQRDVPSENDSHLLPDTAQGTDDLDGSWQEVENDVVIQASSCL